MKAPFQPGSSIPLATEMRFVIVPLHLTTRLGTTVMDVSILEGCSGLTDE